MATSPATEKAPAGRLVYLVALLALAVDSAAAFGRVFRGSGPALRLGLAAGAAILLAWLLERRHVALATLASAAGLAVAVGLLLFPETLWHGLPTATTLRAAGRAWGRIGDVARTEISPARPLDPLFLAGLSAVWAAAFSTHALAIRARSPFLALLPPAALLAFPSILLSEGARPLYVLTFLLAALALLFGDALRRVGQWGPITMWQERRRPRLGTSSSLRGARWVGVCCVGIAVLIPGILPGYRRPGLIDVHSATSGVHVAIDPLVYIKPQLLRSNPVPLFSVTSSVASYWRFAALDTFDGQVWNSKNLDLTSGQDVRAGPLQSQPAPDPPPEALRFVTQTFDFQDLSQDWLPAAFDPVSVFSGTSLRYDPRSSMLANPDGTRTGFSYRVMSQVITPTKDQLDAVASLHTPAGRAYLGLPKIPLRITALAHGLTDDKPRPYEKILAIQNYLRDTFTYDVNAPSGHDIDHMEFFLFKSKAGYCEQFAGTMAVMLRSIGIPARVAVGFTPGETTPQPDTYEVTTDDAHAWVEVLFPHFGWLAFEPTPTRRNPTAAAYQFPQAATGQGGATCAVRSEHPGPGGPARGDPCEPAGQTGEAGRRTPPPQQSSDTGSREAGGPKASHATSWRLLAAEAAGAALLLILASIPAAKIVRRRVIIRRARRAEDRVLAAYGVLSDRAAGLGLGRGAAETLREYTTRLTDRVPGVGSAMDRLAVLAGRAAYAGPGLTEEQAGEAQSAARQAWRLIARSVSLPRRLVGWFWVDRSGSFRRAAG